MAQEPTEFNWDNAAKKPVVTQQVQAGPGIQGTFHGDPKDLANAHLEKDGIEQPLAPARPGGATPGTEPTFQWDKVNSGPSIRAEQHPIEARINSLMNDLKYGPGVNDNRLPERFLRFIGYQGTNKGTSGDPGAMMGGVGMVEGIPELIHAGSKIPQVKSWKGAERVANEGMGGAFKTLAGAAPFIAPTSIVPGMAAGLPRYAAGSTAAGLLGADPETKEFVGDIAAAGTPFEKPAGRLIENNAPAIGKAAGYTATAGKMAHDLAGKNPRINPLDLLFSSPMVTRPVSSLARGVGKTLQALPGPLVETPGRVQPAPEPAGPTTRDAVTGSQTEMPEGKTIEGEPLFNKDGEPITEPPPVKYGLIRLEGEQQPLEKFNNTTDEILENLKAALQHVNESSPVDEKQSAELTQEIKEWEAYKDRVNQSGYENPYFNPREEVAPLINSNNGQPPKGGGEVNYNPDEVTQRGLEQKAPVDELNEPLTNEKGSDIINNDKNIPEEPLIKSNKDIDEKALQQELRADIEKKPKKGDLIETPWEHEPQEGASASLGANSGEAGFRMFNPESDRFSDELDRLYGKDVNDQLIQNKEGRATGVEAGKKNFLKNRLRGAGYDEDQINSVDGMTPEEVRNNIEYLYNKDSYEKGFPLPEENLIDNGDEQMDAMRNKFKQLGYSDRDISHLSREQLEDLWQHIGNNTPKHLIDKATTGFLDQHTGFDDPIKNAISKVRDWAEMRGLHLTENDNVRIRAMIGDGLTFDEIMKELLGDEESEPLTKNDENLIINNKGDSGMTEEPKPLPGNELGDLEALYGDKEGGQIIKIHEGKPLEGTDMDHPDTDSIVKSWREQALADNTPQDLGITRFEVSDEDAHPSDGRLDEDEEDEDYNTYPPGLTDQFKPEEIIDGDEKITDSDSITILFDYPFQKTVEMRFENKGGFNKSQLFKAIQDGYQKLYKLEGEEEPGTSPSLLNRGESKRPVIGIWGHILDDLLMVGAEQPVKDKFILHLDS